MTKSVDIDMVSDETIKKLKTEFKNNKCNFRYKKQGYRQYLTIMMHGLNASDEEVEKILGKHLTTWRKTSSWSGEATYRINGDPVKKTLLEKIDITITPKSNRFGQVPEVGDYAIGIRSSDSKIFIIEIIGWNEKSLIVQPLISSECRKDWNGKQDNHTEPTTMRWADNVIIPKDTFGEDFNEFLVMFKLTMDA